MAESPTRKLAVLPQIDIVGSTSLVQSNEIVAHQRIQDAFKRFTNNIQYYGGICHETRGDALIVEFPRANR